ncbi:Uracil-DNA glycosylase, family 1, partial [hydrothermal vent metagenome]
MEVKIDSSWKAHLADEFEKPYFLELADFVKNEYANEPVYPAPGNIFRAFDLCPFGKVKVVILGQDPYHGTSQANGLCFAVNEDVTIPPSLQNIFKEIASDIGVSSTNKKINLHDEKSRGDLSRWAKQGVLLLNATLTVRAHVAGSHQKRGWEEFTDAVVKELSKNREH